MDRRKLGFIALVAAGLIASWDHLTSLAWELYCSTPFGRDRNMRAYGRRLFDEGQVPGTHNPAYDGLTATQFTYMHGSAATRLALCSPEVLERLRQQVAAMPEEDRARIDPATADVLGISRV